MKFIIPSLILVFLLITSCAKDKIDVIEIIDESVLEQEAIQNPQPLNIMLDDFSANLEYTSGTAANAKVTSIVKNKELSISYTSTSDKDNWAVVNGPNSQDLSSMKYISLWIKNLPTDAYFSFNLRDNDNDAFGISLNGDFSSNEWHYVILPVDKMVRADWSTGNGKLDLDQVSTYYFVVQSGKSLTANFQIKQIEMHQNKKIVAETTKFESGAAPNAKASSQFSNNELLISYTSTSDKDNWATITGFNTQDLTGMKYITLKIKNLPTDSYISFNLRDNDNDAFGISLNGDFSSNVWHNVVVPIEKMIRADWSTGNGKLDLTQVFSYYFVIQSGKALSANFQITNIEMTENKELTIDEFQSGSYEAGAAPNAKVSAQAQGFLSVKYTSTSDKDSWAVVNGKNTHDLSGMKYVSFWVKNVPYDVFLSFNLRDNDNDAFGISLNGDYSADEWKYVYLPIDKMVRADWSTGNGKLDLESTSSYFFVIMSEAATFANFQIKDMKMFT